MSLNEKKAGGAAVDPDDYNEVVDAVVALQSSSVGPQPFIYTGDAPIDGVGTVFKVQEDTPSTSGTFTLTFRGDTTDPIAFDASSQDISTALNMLAAAAGYIAIVEGYEGLFLNVDAIRFVFTGALLGETEDPTVTNDLTDNGVTVGDISTGSAGDPVAPALNDLYVAGSSAFVYVFDGGAWNITRVAVAAISTTQLADLAVTTGKLDAAAVTSGKIANGAVITDLIANHAVNTDKIAANSIVTDQIASGQVTAAHLAFPVAHLAHGATVNDLIDALIAGHVMAAA